MEQFTIYNPTRLHFGEGVTDQLGENVRKYGQKALLIYGMGSVKKYGYYDKVKQQLVTAGLEVVEYGGIKPNPVIEDVRKVQKEFTDKFAKNTKAIDKAAQVLYDESPTLAREFLTGYSCQQADAITKRWIDLSNYLLVKYIDGNIKKEKDGK